MLKCGHIPFGYCVVNGSYVLNEVESEAVRKIFADYIGGKSLKTIASEMKIPYNSGKQNWNLNTIWRIIENRKYIGEKGYPRIISDEDFNHAAMIKAKRRRCRRPKTRDKSQQSVVLMITE